MKRMNAVLKKLRRTEPELISRLKKSARQTKTREERFAQKVSFVYGNQAQGMGFSREEVQQRLREMG